MVAKKEPASSVGTQDTKRKGQIAISGSIDSSLIRVLLQIGRLAKVEVIVFLLPPPRQANKHVIGWPPLELETGERQINLSHLQRHAQHQHQFLGHGPHRSPSSPGLVDYRLVWPGLLHL